MVTVGVGHESIPNVNLLRDNKAIIWLKTQGLSCFRAGFKKICSPPFGELCNAKNAVHFYRPFQHRIDPETILSCHVCQDLDRPEVSGVVKVGGASGRSRVESHVCLKEAPFLCI